MKVLRQKKDRLERGEVAPGRVFRMEKLPDGSLRRVELEPGKHRRKVAAEWKAKTEVARARQSLNLSQAGFAQLLGIGVATLRSWEQGKREPSGAARTLIGIAIKHPEVFE
jgi:DNA-binding transcriptional regulator YiaG